MFGYKVPVNLNIGQYAVGVENAGTANNAIRVELQHQASVAGFRYLQDRFTTIVRNVAAGGRITQPITIGSTYRTLVDGANSGGTVYLIRSSETSNFLAGRTFQYITNNPCSSGTAAPGFCELNFVPGEYAIAYVNDTNESQAIVFYGHDFVPL